jgi:RNA polymerase sigma-70 factor (sigma-B/F/G subfamily)
VLGWARRAAGRKASQFRQDGYPAVDLLFRERRAVRRAIALGYHRMCDRAVGETDLHQHTGCARRTSLSVCCCRSGCRLLCLLAGWGGTAEGMGLGRFEQEDASAGAVSDGELIWLVQTLPHGDVRRDRACESLMARHGHMVRSAVHRYQVPPDVAEDLAQVGYLGLMKAIVNFDPALGGSLAAYAQPCVSGEIKRHFRDKRWQVRVARPTQELCLELRKASGELTQQLARAPSDAELASYLQISPDEVAQARLAGHAFQASSLDEPVAAGEQDSASLGEFLGAEDPRLEHTLDLEALRTHWDELSGPDQQLLLMRFYGNMSQTQIAERLGVSQMQVSRLLRCVLDYLRERISGSAPGPSLWGSITGSGLDG